VKARRARRGFTLAEVAVTIALVGLALAWLLQTLNSAKMTAAKSRNLKLARELAMLTMGQIEAGLFAEELDDERIDGSYADEGYPDFVFEAIIGEATFKPTEAGEAFDNWRREQEEKRASAADEDEQAEQPYEKIQIKVSHALNESLSEDMRLEYVLERWIPWKQAHPPEEGSDEAAAAAAEEGK
jgi:prepilin-type N-terminal cleavage/methylation domain-containing protein